MTAVFAVLLTVHGLVHLLGVAKAFGLAGLLFLWPRGWWMVAGAAIVLSLSAIIPSWVDAKFGVAANALVLTGVAMGWLAKKP